MRSSALCLLASAFCLLASGSLHAADKYWQLNGGDWLTDTWYDAATGGSAVASPTSADAAYIGGVVTLTGNANTSTSFIGNTAALPGSVTVTANSAWTNNTTFNVGVAGSGTLNILAGGAVTTGATNMLFGTASGGVGVANVEGVLQAGAQIRLGNVANSSGTLNIASGATVRATGMYVSLSGGRGVLNVEQGGSLILATAALYLGNSNTFATTYGEANIAGYVESGSGGLYYTPIGYGGGVGVLNIKPTGTLISGQIDIGREANASGTVTIEGYYKSNAGTTLVGSQGRGVLTVSGTMDFAAGSLTVGNSGAGSGILTISGAVRNVSTFYIGNTTTGNNVLDIKPGGILTTTANSWYNRNPPTGDFAGMISGTGAAYIAGTWDTTGYLVIGNVAGVTTLDIASTGTVIARTTGIRVTYGVPESTSYVNVDGYMQSTAYVIFSHYGNSYSRVGPTGVVDAGSYVSVGQGDYYNNVACPADYSDIVSGTLYVEGLVSAYSYVQVANRINATLDIAPSGTVMARTYGVIGTNVWNHPVTGTTVIPSGTVNVRGYLQAGTYFTNGSTGRGFMDISSSGTVNIGTTYSQNAMSTLAVELSNSRVPDELFPDLTSPFLFMGGAATLSGTLRVYGDVSGLNYTGGGEGKASSLSGIPVFRANGGITGDFAVVDIVGITIPSDLPDYIRGGGMKVNEGGPVDTRYDVGYGLAWKSGVESAHGTFTVEPGKTFEVDIQLADRPGMTFTSGWDGKSLTKSGPGTLILSVENAYTGATIVESGTLRFIGPAQYDLGALINNSIIDFYGTDAAGRRVGGFRTIRATSLAGSGTFRMGINLSTGAGDFLLIDGDASGHHRLFITGVGDVPTGSEPIPTLVSIKGVDETSYSAGGIAPDGATFEGNFDFGYFNYSVEKIGQNIVIVPTGMLPEYFEPIKGVPGAQSLLWFDQQDNLTKRLGELRALRGDRGSGVDIWARAHAANATIGGGDSQMRRSDVDFWGVEVGSDYTWKHTGARTTAGVFVGTGDTKQTFRETENMYAADPITQNRTLRATGNSTLFGTGFYAAWMADPGWFVNAAVTAGIYKNKFDALDQSENHTKGDYRDRGFGATVEAGRRIDGSQGWFFEPSVQGAVARLNRGKYTTKGTGSASSNIDVEGSDLTITRMRCAVRIGRVLQKDSFGWMEFAVRGAATSERSSGGEVSVGDANRWRPNLDGTRYEAGISAYWRPRSLNSLIYLDYEFVGGDNYRKPWGVSLGFRLFL